MRRRWRHDARHIDSIPTVIPRLMQLETAKEMLCGIFNARPAGVVGMIRRRLAGISRTMEQMPGDGLWPATLCLGE